MIRTASLYVHFPWCVRKCPYCDFNSHPLKGELPESAYVDALLEDLRAQLKQNRIQRVPTVFFGGGTPSLFSPGSFARLLETLGPLLDDDAEVTMEANPGTTEHQDLGGYKRAGINRLSLGAQSFDDAKLSSLGRVHNAAAIYTSFELARAAGFDNINLDLMYGLPQQTRSDALGDLSAAIALVPEHISWYQLTLEPKTEFYRRPPPLPGDLMLEAVETAGYQLLGEAGFERYEVSAFARPGRQCRHNLGYWSFGDYLGAGAGAHGKLRRGDGSIVRTRKAHQPRLYLAAATETEEEALSTSEVPGEFMLNALRLKAGVSASEFQAATGLPLAALEPARGRQIASGLLAPDRLAATERGYALLDSLIQDYL